ncbi:hypothetical protein AB833_06060 [Chromatiales bacterium (ex Bugula neritina AB1)]|nr:hypothetical protein AB833_06060 [Chromatiales bacterium (ex Bugula neritina AB1)]
MSLKTLFDKIESLTAFSGKVAAWIVVTLAASMLWEVVSRYVFSKPTTWSYEIAYMQMGALFVLGIAYTMQQDAHVRVDLFYNGYSTKGKALVNVLGLLLLLPMVGWLCFGLWHYLENAWQSGERSGESIWNPHVWPARASFFIGFVLFALQTLSEIYKSVKVINSRDSDPAVTQLSD